MASVPPTSRIRRGRGTPGARIGATAALAVALLTAWSGVGAAASAGSATPANAWTVYHGDPLGSAVGPNGESLSPLRQHWRSPVLDGELFGEPLVADNLGVVATEGD